MSFFRKHQENTGPADPRSVKKIDEIIRGYNLIDTASPSHTKIIEFIKTLFEFSAVIKDALRDLIDIDDARNDPSPTLNIEELHPKRERELKSMVCTFIDISRDTAEIALKQGIFTKPNKLSPQKIAFIKPWLAYLENPAETDVVAVLGKALDAHERSIDKSEYKKAKSPEPEEDGMIFQLEM